MRFALLKTLGYLEKCDEFVYLFVRIPAQNSVKPIIQITRFPTVFSGIQKYGNDKGTHLLHLLSKKYVVVTVLFHQRKYPSHVVNDKTASINQ